MKLSYITDEFSVISLYNEQLKTVQNILGRAMLNNIDDFRRNANMLIGITVTALIFIALVEPFLFWANISTCFIALISGNLLITTD